MVFESLSSPKFVQFVKIVEASDQSRLHFGLPDVKWSRLYFARVRESLREAGIECVVTTTGDKRVPAFLTADHLDLNEAHTVLRTLWGVMARPEETRLRVTFWGRLDPREPTRHLPSLCREDHKGRSIDRLLQRGDMAYAWADSGELQSMSRQGQTTSNKKAEKQSLFECIRAR